MHVVAVRMQHFRQFEDQWVFPNERANIIVGPNNSGKTSLLEALRLLLDPHVRHAYDETVVLSDFKDARTAEPIELTAWLDTGGEDAPEGARELLGYLSRWCLCSDPQRLEPAPAEPMESVETGGSSQSDQPLLSLLCVRLRASWSEPDEAAEIEYGIVDETDRVARLLPRASRELIDFRYYPVDRDPARELSFAWNKALHRRAGGDLDTALRRIVRQLDGSTSGWLDGQTISALLRTLDGLIHMPLLVGAGETRDRFTVTFQDGGLRGLRTAMSLALDGDGVDALPLSRQGRGFQNALLLALIAHDLEASEANPIVAIEEPEQNLDPPLARWMMGRLCRVLDRTGAPGSPEARGQVLITTHAPALASEYGGVESLLIMTPGASLGRGPTRVTSGRELSPDPAQNRALQKSIERNADRYGSALFARHVLIVEGDSEVGFLPVAFDSLAEGDPSQNPLHQGFAIVSAGGKNNVGGVAQDLRACGKRCYVLLDHDPDESGDDRAASGAARHGARVLSWSNSSKFRFTPSVDLEAVLAGRGDPREILSAVRRAYKDPGHELKPGDWADAMERLKEGFWREQIPGSFPACFSEPEKWRLSSVCPLLAENGEDGNECPLGPTQSSGCDSVCARAFLYAAMVGPHCCKAVYDMRVIAECLAERQAIPDPIRKVRDELLRLAGEGGEDGVDEPILTII